MVSPGRVCFTIFGIDIMYYGVLIGLGFILATIISYKRAPRLGIKPDSFIDVIIWLIPAALIGARAYYVIFNWSMYQGNIKEILNVRNGGLAIHGGILLGILAVYIVCKRDKENFLDMLDLCVPVLALGQAIGRWGNFFNQEAFGTTTTLPWGMTSETVSDYLSRNCPNLDSSMPVHPTFFYEFTINIALFFFLLWVRKHSKYAFETTSVYMIVYGIARFFLEGLRTDSLYLGNTNIRTSQLLSLILVVFGLLYIAYAQYNDRERLPLPERLFETQATVKKENKEKKETK